MMAFANGWGWASWLILALIMFMFAVVVGGVGVMFWVSGRSGQEPPGEEEPTAAPDAQPLGAPPTA